MSGGRASSPGADDAARLIAARTLRGVGDGALSVIVPLHLLGLGFGPGEVSAIIAATLLGSSLLTLAVGFLAHRCAARALLLAGCGLMAATALGFAAFETLAPLVIVALLGTFNPSEGDVTAFLPIEQALLAGAVEPRGWPALYARYNLGGALGAALGALGGGLPASFAFAGYALLALLLGCLYRELAVSRVPAAGPARGALERSRRPVLQLAALFSLDAFGGGFAVQSLLVVWLHRRFGVTAAEAGAVFFAAALLGAFSQLVAARLAQRIGLVRTMVFTHVPANVLLIAAAFMPSAPLAIALLLGRAALSKMDVPARQALVMALVPPEERAAAASVTSVPRSLATALAPLPAGGLLGSAIPGAPLVVGGALKLVYDLWLFAAFRKREPGV